MFIAAEARAEAGVGAPTTVPADSAVTPQPRGADPRWYILLTSLFVAVGGIVIPVVGWIIGIVMVWASKSWRTWEKWVATVLPIGAGVVAGVLSTVMASVGQAEGSAGGAPQFGNLDGPWPSFLVVAFLNVVVGIWLLWRGLRRSASG